LRYERLNQTRYRCDVHPLRLDQGLTDPVSAGIRGLNELAKKLKQKRIDAGALTLASTEIKFIIDKETQAPEDVQM
jgi:exosome complex exonuclease DIS3/RRP44